MCVSKGCLCVCVCLCKRVVCVDVQACLTLVLSTKTNFESTTKEVGRMSSTNQEVVFCVPCSVSCEIVRVNFASSACLEVQEPSPAAAAPPAPCWRPTGVAFIFFFFLICFSSCFQFSIFHFLIASFSFLLSAFFVFDKAHFFKEKSPGHFFIFL